MRELIQFKRLYLIALLAVFIIGCNGGTKFCCQDENRIPLVVERQYCLNHTDAVRLWVQTPTDTSLQRDRLENFVILNDDINNCATVDCIEQKLQESTAPIDLWTRYQDEHADAELRLSDLTITLQDAKKAELIKCGFNHAIQIGIQ